MSTSQPKGVLDDIACNKAIPTGFATASIFHANAKGCSIRRVEIDFPPMVQVAKACSTIFELVDRNESSQRTVARDAWLLKAALMLTLLPFDDKRLSLVDMVSTLELAAESVPEILNPVMALRRLVADLIAKPTNPKRAAAIQMLEPSGSALGPIALFANLHGARTPGWPIDIDDHKDLGGFGTQIIYARKDVRDRSFSRIVVPGNPKFTPRRMLFDLLYGGRSSEVVVLSYRAERATIPEPVNLPMDQFFACQPHDPGPREIAVAEQLAIDQIDQWAHDSFWDSIRATHGDVAPQSARDVSVRARFALFADGSGAFLPEDGRVVEIADRLDHGHELDAEADRLPRKAVVDLEEGDLVMLRLAGSGDYLDDVADSIMKQAGDDELRSRALEWKDWLNRVLKRHGEGVVARKLRDLNVAMRSPQYLWAWAGDAVMAPHDFATFASLIRAINELDAHATSLSINDYAQSKWNEMEQVKAYHHKAGLAIRTALVKRVHDLVAEQTRIDTVQIIELAGVQAGKMGLLRVSAVDTKTMRVPLSRLFHLEKVNAR